MGIMFQAIKSSSSDLSKLKIFHYSNAVIKWLVVQRNSKNIRKMERIGRELKTEAKVYKKCMKLTEAHSHATHTQIKCGKFYT